MKTSVLYFSYNYNVFETSETDKIRDAVFMFTDLFGTSRFDIDCLIRLVASASYVRSMPMLTPSTSSIIY